MMKVKIAIEENVLVVSSLSFAFFFYNSGPPSLVVGESGGVRLYTATQQTGTVLYFLLKAG